ncbi:MAG TPA: SDR family NAD(P)-dependent oxidoreductase [Pyrinomonadaceae bacterium]|jgi:3-oxoacyl-[acyl-carrier protein] reductase|nr:SDR family NAD(P)-dependent oxidoreductase [Pyrinomonadaceae bacterium]
MSTASPEERVLLVTGTSRGIGEYLAGHYVELGFKVIGCSRRPATIDAPNYRHFCMDIASESDVKRMFAEISDEYGRLDVLINNAGIASMNHILLTPVDSVRKIFETNFVGTFLCSREAAKLMKGRNNGRIINFATVATPLKLEGEAIYAASKAAIISFTEIIARELASFGITVNAIGPSPIQTDLIRSVPEEKITKLVELQAIKRLGEFRDVSNATDFFIRPESDFVTGQVLFLGGV